MATYTVNHPYFRIVDIGREVYSSNEGYDWQYLIYANPRWPQGWYFVVPDLTRVQYYPADAVPQELTLTTPQTSALINALADKLAGITVPTTPEDVYNGYRSISNTLLSTGDWFPGDWFAGDWDTTGDNP